MKTTTAELDPKAFAKLRQLIGEIKIAMITTATPDGVLRSRPMVTCHASNEGEIWFFTADDSGKVRDIAEEHAVNVSYADPDQQRYVSVSGNAAIVHDRKKAHELWTPALATYLAGGVDDPHLALLCVRVETAEFWAFPHSANETNEEDDNGDGHTKIDVRATPSSG